MSLPFERFLKTFFQQVLYLPLERASQRNPANGKDNKTPPWPGASREDATLIRHIPALRRASSFLSLFFSEKQFAQEIFFTEIYLICEVESIPEGPAFF